jgi:hypothetical protein
MTQHPIFEGQTVFQSIGFHAALILNRLRNERLMKESTERDTARSQKQKEEEEKTRAELAKVNGRLKTLADRDEDLRRQREHDRAVEEGLGRIKRFEARYRNNRS